MYNNWTPSPTPAGYSSLENIPVSPMPGPPGGLMNPAMQFMQDLQKQWQQFLHSVTERYQSSPLREQLDRFKQQMASRGRGSQSEISPGFFGGPPPPPSGFPPSQGFPPSPPQGLYPPPGFPTSSYQNDYGSTTPVVESTSSSTMTKTPS